MAGLSIQLNRFSVDSQHLDNLKMVPVHKKRVEGYLSKIFQQHVGETAFGKNKETPFQIQFKTGRPVLCLNDQEISLSKSRELKKLGKIIRYYQHMGYLPREEPPAKEIAQSKAEALKSVRAVNQANVPGTNGNLLAGMRLADDTLSLTRNILFAIPHVGPKDPVVSHLGYYAGIFWSFFSLRELDDGMTEYKRSKTIGDTEGKRRAEARILSGGIVSTASIGYLAGKFCDTYASSAAASTVLRASNILFGIGSVVAMGASILGVVRCNRFNKQLDEYLDNPHFTEVQKLQGALQFFKDSIAVTPEERAELVLQIDQKHPLWTPEQKELLFKQKLADLTEVKVKYMKRRTSNKSIDLILSQADRLIEKLGCKTTYAEGIKEAIILINTIRQESKIKTSLYILGLIAAMLSFLGIILMVFFTAGALPFVLYSAAGAIYLAMSIYTIVGQLFKKEGNRPVEMPPGQNLACIA